MTTPSTEASSGKRWRASERMTAALVLVVTLLVGVVLGVAADRTFIWHSFSRPGRIAWGGPQPHASDWMKRFRERMQRELGLTADQQTRIDSIMTRRSAAFQAVRKETEARVNAMVDTTRQMIDSVLTPEQRVQMAKIRARMHRPGGPGGFGGGFGGPGSHGGPDAGPGAPPAPQPGGAGQPQ